ncbi:hypothetical protein B0H11DRAFT_1899110 [Mycena galericulata]|nr:hypothetical protein B0H11DRAFT_1899110 [Mycena galericulata]
MWRVTCLRHFGMQSRDQKRGEGEVKARCGEMGHQKKKKKQLQIGKFGQGVEPGFDLRATKRDFQCANSRHCARVLEPSNRLGSGRTKFHPSIHKFYSDAAAPYIPLSAESPEGGCVLLSASLDSGDVAGNGGGGYWDRTESGAGEEFGKGRGAGGRWEVGGGGCRMRMWVWSGGARSCARSAGRRVPPGLGPDAGHGYGGLREEWGKELCGVRVGSLEPGAGAVRQAWADVGDGGARVCVPGPIEVQAHPPPTRTSRSRLTPMADTPPSHRLASCVRGARPVPVQEARDAWPGCWHWVWSAHKKGSGVWAPSEGGAGWREIHAVRGGNEHVERGGGRTKMEDREKNGPAGRGEAVQSGEGGRVLDCLASQQVALGEGRRVNENENRGRTDGRRVDWMRRRLRTDQGQREWRVERAHCTAAANSWFAGGRRWTPLASGNRWQILFAIGYVGSNSGCRQSTSAFTGSPMAPSGSHWSLVSRAASHFRRKPSETTGFRWSCFMKFEHMHQIFKATGNPVKESGEQGVRNIYSPKVTQIFVQHTGLDEMEIQYTELRWSPFQRWRLLAEFDE